MLYVSLRDVCCNNYVFDVYKTCACACMYREHYLCQLLLLLTRFGIEGNWFILPPRRVYGSLPSGALHLAYIIMLFLPHSLWYIGDS